MFSIITMASSTKASGDGERHQRQVVDREAGTSRTSSANGPTSDNSTATAGMMVAGCCAERKITITTSDGNGRKFVSARRDAEARMVMVRSVTRTAQPTPANGAQLRQMALIELTVRITLAPGRRCTLITGQLHALALTIVGPGREPDVLGVIDHGPRRREGGSGTAAVAMTSSRIRWRPSTGHWHRWCWRANPTKAAFGLIDVLVADAVRMSSSDKPSCVRGGLTWIRTAGFGPPD